jgi:uncharacterized protein (DUF2147 family)
MHLKPRSRIRIFAKFSDNKRKEFVMRPDQKYLRAALFTATLTGSGSVCAGSDPTGVWINDTGRGAIEIKHCGQALCGHVVWTKDSADAKGCGKQIIGDAAKVGAQTWDNGWIYSPEKKAKFDVELKPLDNGRLRVTGYAGTKLFSKTMIWTRAPADLRRCDHVDAAVTPPPAPVPKPAEASAKPVATPPSSPSTAEAEAKPAPAQPMEVHAALEPPATAANDKTEKDMTDAAADPATTAATAEVIPAEAEPEPTPAAKPAVPPRAKTAARRKVDNEDSPSAKPKRRMRVGNLDLDGLKHKVIKRTGSGRCKLDLPWVKVRFRCED